MLPEINLIWFDLMLSPRQSSFIRNRRKADFQKNPTKHTATEISPVKYSENDNEDCAARLQKCRRELGLLE